MYRFNWKSPFELNRSGPESTNRLLRSGCSYILKWVINTQQATWVLPNNFHGWSGPQSVTQTAAAAAAGATHFDTDSDNLFRLHLEKNSHGLINYRKFLNSSDKN